MKGIKGYKTTIYREAEKRIALNKQSQNIRLNLSHLRISALPAMIGKLVWLRKLDLSYTYVADLSPLKNLTNLQSLDFNNTEVTDLSPLKNLTNLQSLNLGNNKVTDLSPLKNLTNLQSLNLGNNKVTDLSPLKNLTILQLLDLGNTTVTDLSPLKNLTILQLLDLGNTTVTDLSPLQALIRKGVPVKWVSYPGESGIYVYGCPLKKPSPHVVAQGNEAILNYFEELARGEEGHLLEIKLLIIGEGGVGKTSLLRRLYQPELDLPEEDETTRGIEVHQHSFPTSEGKDFRLNVWDFGGQQIYHATHQFFLTNRSLYLLVDDTRSDDTSIYDEGFKRWLDRVDILGGHSPVLIFQNEKGGRSKNIDINGIHQHFDNVHPAVFRGNLAMKESVDALRKEIERQATGLSDIGEKFPEGWLKVRAEIEELAQKKEYITVEEFFTICARHLGNNRERALYLSRHLHAIGVLLHFQDDPLLRRDIILQNDWATNAVFRILDDETIKENRGRFTKVDCQRLWQEERYNAKHEELLALMQKFEICYELPGTKEHTWLAPQLLLPGTPSGVLNWGKPGDLCLRYRYEFLPDGIISRLIVRLHRYIRNPELAWKDGALFESGSASAIVRRTPKHGEIELRARGVTRKELLSVISADMDALNDSFTGLKGKSEKLIPCHCSACMKAPDPHFFEYEELVRRKENKRQTIECPKEYAEMAVLELLDGVSVIARSNEPPPVYKSTPPAELNPVRIFLASSTEMLDERDRLDLYLRRQNDSLTPKGFYLQVVRWEYSDSAMSRTRSQDEYNRNLRNCDIMVCLFRSKVGNFTEEEFDVAREQFLKTGKPRIYTFFHDADTSLSAVKQDDMQSLWKFQEKLKNLGHFYRTYKRSADLILQIRDQLDLWLRETNLLRMGG
ncbi:MAG: leucine-rich repeat domain-containing protein [Deltaproteobacteria bacterium]|nr:leucine-rich repeat domain-containing protein [Deltaproteobacteria bacterium]